MIIFFRKINDSFVGKIFIAVLAVGMVMTFGVAGIFGSLGTKTTAISVGPRRVSIAELDRALNNEIRRVSSSYGDRYISPKEAIQMGLLTNVINQKKNDLLSDVMLDDIGTVASDASVRSYLINNPLFQTITGSFDRQLFMMYLSRLQMNEAQFAAASQTKLAENHVFDAVSAAVTVPESALDKVYAFENEMRDFDILLITPDRVKVSETPTDADLNDYYDAMQEDLYTPEYRRFSVLTLDNETLGKNIVVSEDEVRALYENSKALYTTPEQRHIKQILVTEENLPMFDGSVTIENFEQMAEKNGQSAADTDLGWVEKAGVNEAVGEAAFEASAGTVVGPVQSEWGYHFLKVEGIKPAVETSFAEIKNDLKSRLVSEKAYDILYDKSRELDDALGAGESLQAVSQKMGIPLQQIDFVDAEGSFKSKTGQAEILPEILQQVFMLDEGETTGSIERNGRFVVAQVEQIEPSVLPPPEKVKDVLVAEWTKDRQKEQVSAFADKVYQTAKQNGDFKRTAALFGLEQQTPIDVKRAELADLPDDVTKTLFSLNVGKVELIPAGESFVVAKALKVTKADKDDKVGMINLQNALNQLFAQGVKDEVLDFYGHQAGVEVDQKLIDDTFSVYLKNEE